MYYSQSSTIFILLYSLFFLTLQVPPQGPGRNMGSAGDLRPAPAASDWRRWRSASSWTWCWSSGRAGVRQRASRRRRLHPRPLSCSAAAGAGAAKLRKGEAVFAGHAGAAARPPLGCEFRRAHAAHGPVSGGDRAPRTCPLRLSVTNNCLNFCSCSTTTTSNLLLVLELTQTQQ